MKNRIRQIRKASGMTQEQFAEKIGAKRSTIAAYEAGNNIPLDPIVKSICEKFGVREEWLRTGEGEMLAPEPESGNDREKLVDSIADEYGLDATDRAILTLYLDMDAKDRDYVNAYVLRLLREALEQNRGKPDAAPLTDTEISERVAAYESLLKGIQQIEQLPDASTGTPKPTSASSGADYA